MFSLIYGIVNESKFLFLKLDFRFFNASHKAFLGNKRNLDDILNSLENPDDATLSLQIILGHEEKRELLLSSKLLEYS